MSAPAPDDTNSLVEMLLAENKRPTEDEELRIRKAIPGLQREVLKIEPEYNEIDIALAIIPPEQTPDAHLTERFERLKACLYTARERLACHTKSISYSREIPVEVLEVIFRFCIQEDYVKPSPLQAPLLLCQICSVWRRVVLATPFLWCSLSVNLNRRPGMWKDFLEGWLGRCGKTPISIRFEGDHNQYFNDHITRWLWKSVKTWRRLQLDCDSSAMTKLFNSSMPMLETLELKSRGGLSGLYIPSTDAPRLCSLSLLGDKMDPTRIHLPWGRLTQFHSAKSALGLDKCFTLLAKCKNLTHCTIQLATLDEFNVSQSFPVRMPRLHSLVVIGSIHQHTVTVFFANVDLPVLDNLKLEHVRHEPFFIGPQSSIATLARKSNLRSLWLSRGRPLEGLFDTVVAIPSLREVIINSGIALPPAVQEALDMRK
ncbi:hypothetical protein K438DRAFT_1977900 [Mycena galopus ATCC 62051]|nr:hypothetical protein K438DRAFT_1977900 [Mycena galopus ATCC 62051]